MEISMGIIAAFAVPHPPLIIPEIGQGREEEIRRTTDAYQEAARRIGACKPDTIVLFSPHQTMYADYFHISPGDGAQGDFGQFGAGQVSFQVAYDTEFVRKLCQLSQDGTAQGEDKPVYTREESSEGAGFLKRNPLPAGTMGEREPRLDHGTMVPLYFVNQYWHDYRLVRMGLSGLSLVSHYELGQCVKEAAELLGRRVVLIASGDLSHRLKEDGPYGFREEGPEYDRRVMDVLGRGSFGELLDFSEGFCESAGECGHRAFVMMAGALDRTGVHAECLSYEGPFGVGYGICVYEVQGEDGDRNFKEQYEERQRRKAAEQRSREDSYVRLARKTIEQYIRTGEKLRVPEGLPEEMYGKRAGVFVSIKKEGRLRGCIGTIQAVRSSVAEEIIENAISAATGDPRFAPVEAGELERLTISVDVLGDTEKIASSGELDVKRYGVIVTKGYRRGLLLPNLEGVDTVQEQIAIAKRKAGIGEEEEAELERFEVVRHF